MAYRKYIKWLIGAAVMAAVVVAVVVGVVVGVQNRYPNYSQVNYSLVNTYEGPSFFDQFDYFSGEDPTYGFVQ